MRGAILLIGLWAACTGSAPLPQVSIEERLQTHEPPDEGLMSDSLEPAPPEVRIVLCLDGDVDAHLRDKGAHDRAGREWPSMSEVALFVDRESFGSAAIRDGQVAPEAQARYDAVARAVAARRVDDETSVVIDADSEVPTQHVIGILNALHAADVARNIRYAGNPRLNRYFGRDR